MGRAEVIANMMLIESPPCPTSVLQMDFLTRLASELLCS